MEIQMLQHVKMPPTPDKANVTLNWPQVPSDKPSDQGQGLEDATSG